MQSLDHILLERLCHESYNNVLPDYQIPVNLRNYEIMDDHIYCEYTTGSSNSITTSVIPISIYMQRQREQKLKDIGI